MSGAERGAVHGGRLGWARVVAACAVLSTACASGTASERPAGAEPAVNAGAGDAVSIALTFVDHLQIGMPIQDVFIERKPRSGEVFRVTNDDKDMAAELYAAPRRLARDPLAVGPHAKGRRLGVTVGDWLGAAGSGRYDCRDGKADLAATFTGLVPNGLYTMWHFSMARPPAARFDGTQDLPIGATDGSENVFRADADGRAEFRASGLEPCLERSNEHVESGLAIAWHSDGKTYGADPGPWGHGSHVQLLLLLPGDRSRAHR